MTMLRSITSSLIKARVSRSNIRYQNLSTLKDEYEYVKVERHLDPQGENGVGLIMLNRPSAHNALCDALFDDLIHAGRALDEDEHIGCMVLTGSQKIFAAGADIKEMSARTFEEVYKKNQFAQWAQFTTLKKPVIAAVNGFALGGGCELAMMCDIIFAGDKAQFGQPEINLGVIPGAGGTQRLVKAIGKSKAMHMILTGERINAQKALDYGLVADIFPADSLVDDTLKIAKVIASKGRISIMMAKEAVNAADELSLQEGLRFERRLFHALFATSDQKEGMDAFLEKREPKFTHK